MAREISNHDDVIDSRDVIARLKELQDERDALKEAVDEAGEDADSLEDAQAELEQWDSDNGDELKALASLCEEAEGYAGDWLHGATLVADSYFEDYARQLAEDIGAIDRNASWPNNFIDWSAAADALKQDYSEVDFDGVSYWVRS